MESAGIFVDEVDERPARLVRILGISVVGWAIFTALNLARARFVSASIDLFVTGAIAAALVIGRRFPRRVGWAAHAGGALCAGGLTVVSLVQGQSAAMASWFLVASPIFGGYIGGRRAAIGWTIAASLLLAIVHLSPLWVQIEPEFVHEEPEVWMGALVLTLALLSFAIADLRVHREHVEALARRGATVAAQARELAAARDRAVALAAAKDEFLATMSHEIRTPLNGVLGLAEVLARSELSPRDAERVRTIVSSGEALRTLLSDLLEAARADSGKLELDPRPVHVPTLLARCVELMRAQAESKGLALSLAVDDGVGPWAVLDEVRARQVILNLLGNAVKFTPQGQVRVAARALAGAGAGPELEVTVSDTGVGIAAAERSSIFDPFRRSVSLGLRQIEGTGLGLAISRKLARLMGGDLDFESVEGAGSTFRFTLRAPPTAAPVQAQAAGEAATGASAAGEAARAAPLRVLVVDDQEVNLVVAEAMLEALGHGATRCTSGEEAATRLAEGAFDVVLMDMWMPGRDGLETTRALRAAGVRLPIVALTANASEGDRRRCLDAGMDEFLSKPLTIEGLAGALGRVTRGAMAGAMAGATA